MPRIFDFETRDVRVITEVNRQTGEITIDDTDAFVGGSISQFQVGDSILLTNQNDPDDNGVYNRINGRFVQAEPEPLGTSPWVTASSYQELQHSINSLMASVRLHQEMMSQDLLTVPIIGKMPDDLRPKEKLSPYQKWERSISANK